MDKWFDKIPDLDTGTQENLDLIEEMLDFYYGKNLSEEQ